MERAGNAGDDVPLLQRTDDAFIVYGGSRSSIIGLGTIRCSHVLATAFEASEDGDEVTLVGLSARSLLDWLEFTAHPPELSSDDPDFLTRVLKVAQTLPDHLMVPILAAALHAAPPYISQCHGARNSLFQPDAIQATAHAADLPAYQEAVIAILDLLSPQYHYLVLSAQCFASAGGNSLIASLPDNRTGHRTIAAIRAAEQGTSDRAPVKITSLTLLDCTWRNINATISWLAVPRGLSWQWYNSIVSGLRTWWGGTDAGVVPVGEYRRRRGYLWGGTGAGLSLFNGMTALRSLSIDIPPVGGAARWDWLPLPVSGWLLGRGLRTFPHLTRLCIRWWIQMNEGNFSLVFSQLEALPELQALEVSSCFQGQYRPGVPDIDRGYGALAAWPYAKPSPRAWGGLSKLRKLTNLCISGNRFTTHICLQAQWLVLLEALAKARAPIRSLDVSFTMLSAPLVRQGVRAALTAPEWCPALSCLERLCLTGNMLQVQDMRMLSCLTALTELRLGGQSTVAEHRMKLATAACMEVRAPRLAVLELGGLADTARAPSAVSADDAGGVVHAPALQQFSESLRRCAGRCPQLSALIMRCLMPSEVAAVLTILPMFPELRELDLCGSQLDSENEMFLAESIRKESTNARGTLTALSLECMHAPPMSFTQLVRGLGTFTNLQRLAVGGTAARFVLLDAVAVAEGFACQRHLSWLSISGCQFAALAEAELAAALSSMHDLEVLRLVGCRIQGDGMNMIADVLPELPRLSVLALDTVGGPRDAVQSPDSASMDIHAVHRILPRLTGLRQLHLGCMLTPADQQMLSQVSPPGLRLIKHGHGQC